MIENDVMEPGFLTTRMLDDATRTLGVDPTSPYADAERRTVACFEESKQTAADPERAPAWPARPRPTECDGPRRV